MTSPPDEDAIRVAALERFARRKTSGGVGKKPKRNYSAQCDTLASKIVRARGVCELAGNSTECGGPFQCCHGFSRRYRSIRWSMNNLFCGCRNHHMYYTHHPLEFDEFLRERWGDLVYRAMREHALRGPIPDVKELLVQLRAEASVA